MIDLLVEIRRLVYIFIVFGIPLMFGAIFVSAVPGCLTKENKSGESKGSGGVGKSMYEKPTWEW